MRKRLVILASITAILLASCCKAICLDDELRISFQQFTVSETDTVLYVKYKPGTTEPLDSIWKETPSAPSLPGTTLSAHTETLPTGFDWQVYLPALDRQFFLTNIQTGTDKCKCESGTYKTVNGYTLNGTPQQGSYIILK